MDKSLVKGVRGEKKLPRAAINKDSPRVILPYYNQPLHDSNKPLQGSSIADLPNCNKPISNINCHVNVSQVQVPNVNDHLFTASEPQLPLTASYNVNTPCYNKEWSLSLNINSLQGPALNRELQLLSNQNCHLNSSKASSIYQRHHDYQNVDNHLNSSKDCFCQLSNPLIEIDMYAESPLDMGQVNTCFDTSYQPPLPSIFGT
ncbi:19646_t:CDS:2 [Dentiscutata erythropus]|uniref:19646_t:CDS:1 n=1 Tax=Dentiscutata erythropus TaxID=1348616 RepID=A0A9N9DIA9_9GLOM|nr:19646_t:CDS:2 [Dentiscutata erythropus]